MTPDPFAVDPDARKRKSPSHLQANQSCAECQVAWHGEPECWFCGEVVTRAPLTPAPGYGAMGEEAFALMAAWGQVFSAGYEDP
jgi:hypothetical protein